jgi:hypothetical protein
MVQYLPVSWNQYHELARKLAATILSHEKKYDEIVAISRGGLTLGHLLSDLMDLPISTFTIQSYSDIESQGEVKITQELTKPIGGRNILLADDVADSGKTINRALDYLRDFRPESITTVTMFYKPRSSFRPEFFGKTTTKWILFPYEPTEMIALISRNMTKANKTKKEIQDFLMSLGYTEKQIAFVRKYHLS